MRKSEKKRSESKEKLKRLKNKLNKIDKVEHAPKTSCFCLSGIISKLFKKTD